MYKNWIFVLTESCHKLSQKGKRINCIHVHIIHKKVSRNGSHVNNLITSPSRQKKLETILKITKCSLIGDSFIHRLHQSSNETNF